ncbi:MAG: tryptophan--tRNA ligase [Candidatus Altiarchaeota archaeon]
MDPWAISDVGDYGKLMEDFGIDSIEKYRKVLDEFKYVRRGVIFGHRDFSSIVESISNSRPYAMMTGLMPSGKFHFGHKMVAEEIIWFQEKRADVFVCAADMESYLMRDIGFVEARRIALEEYLANYFALGLKRKNFHFWFQSDYITEFYRLRDMASKRVTFNELKAIYGELSPGKIISVLTQVADILHPQLECFGGPRPVVVPVGVDQDPHIRLTRDIASRLSADRDGGSDFKCIPPSATYHKFMQGLEGGKMSSSNTKSYIALTDDPDEAAGKVMRAKTGGRETLEEQKRIGGEPEKCVVYELYLYHLIDDDIELSRIYHECRSGKLMCGDDKKNCAELVRKFLVKHQAKLVKARETASKIVGSV